MASTGLSVMGDRHASTPFEAHILSLLSMITQQPSPGYPFPDQPTFRPFDGAKSQSQDIIERSVMSLGKRLWDSERAVSASAATGDQGASLLTPDWTPPVADTRPVAPASGPCPTCARPAEQSSPSHMPTSATFPTISSHPLSASLSTPPVPLSSIRPMGNSNNSPPHNILTTSNGASVLTGGPQAAGWGVRGVAGETGMSAEKELELLKAQVQDIARVCKVSHSFLKPIAFADCLGGRYWRSYAEDHRTG